MAHSNDGQASLSKTFSIILALVIPLLCFLLVGPLGAQPATTPVVYALVGFAVYWALTVCLIVIIWFGESKQLASLNVKRPSWRM